MIAAKQRYGGRLQGRRHQECDHQGDGGGGAWTLGPLDILHNNVGVEPCPAATPNCSTSPRRRSTAASRSTSRAVLACKHVIADHAPAASGTIVNISSMAAIGNYPYVAYKATKVGDDRADRAAGATRTRNTASASTCILPGLMNTPMAVDTRARECKKTRAEVEAERDSQGAAAPEDGHGLGRRQRRAVSRLR